MGTYPCTGGDNKLHYHFGHSSLNKRAEGWKALQRYRYRTRLVYLFYEARRRVRFLVTGREHTGAHKR